MKSESPYCTQVVKRDAYETHLNTRGKGQAVSADHLWSDHSKQIATVNTDEGWEYSAPRGSRDVNINSLNQTATIHTSTLMTRKYNYICRRRLISKADTQSIEMALIRGQNIPPKCATHRFDLNLKSSNCCRNQFHINHNLKHLSMQCISTYLVYKQRSNQKCGYYNITKLCLGQMVHACHQNLISNNVIEPLYNSK